MDDSQLAIDCLQDLEHCLSETHCTLSFLNCQEVLLLAGQQVSGTLNAFPILTGTVVNSLWTTLYNNLAIIYDDKRSVKITSLLSLITLAKAAGDITEEDAVRLEQERNLFSGKESVRRMRNTRVGHRQTGQSIEKALDEWHISLPEANLLWQKAYACANEIADAMHANFRDFSDDSGEIQIELDRLRVIFSKKA